MSYRRWPYSANLPAWPDAPPAGERDPEGGMMPQWQPYAVQDPAQLPGRVEARRWDPTVGDLSRWGGQQTFARNFGGLPFLPELELARTSPTLPVPQTIRLLAEFVATDDNFSTELFLSIGLGSTVIQRRLAFVASAGVPTLIEVLQPAQQLVVSCRAFPITIGGTLVAKAFLAFESPLLVGAL